MTRPTRRGLLGVTATSALLLGACSSGDESSPRSSRTPSPASRSPASSSASTTSTAAPSAAASSTDAAQVSLGALTGRPPSSGPPQILRTIDTTDAYTRYAITYPSDGLTISGVLLQPAGQGPFPGVVLDHGHVDETTYMTGDDLTREQDALARAGFAVLHTDYRGLADSDPVDPLDKATGLGYVRDAVNAVASLSTLPYVDTDKLAMLGVSMGGGVAMGALVTQPGLVAAGVLYDSISSDFLQTAEQFAPASGSGVVRQLSARFGTPDADPGFWEGLSARTYFDQITAPVLLHHGTDDGTCPLSWSQDTQRLMQAASVDATLKLWPGEHHIFQAQWQDAMDVTLDFLRARLGL